MLRPGLPCQSVLLMVVLLRPLIAHNFDLRQHERERVLSLAAKYLDELPLTITSFPCERSAGGRHDFYSEGDYWWPNPSDPTGPYIQRDGLTNPANFVKHRQLLWRFSQIVPALVAAYLIDSKPLYIERALAHLRTWFVDEQTRMNPHLRYAQAIKGRATGRSIGIIDTIHLVEVARALQVMELKGVVTAAESKLLKQWFAEYLEWLFTSDFGQAERDQGNNHSTCWAMQVAQFAALINDTARLSFCRQFYKQVLLPEQMADNGSFPRELKRTKPYSYSLFNLDAMATLCQILSTPDDNLWEFTTNDGKNFKRAVEFMFHYVEDKHRWQYSPDVMYYEYWPVCHPFLLFAGNAYREQRYLLLWAKLPQPAAVDEVIRNFPIRQPLLWIDTN